MESEGFSNDGPYGAAMGGAKSASRNGGPGGEVSMGFPSAKASGKGQQLIEIYGVRYDLAISFSLLFRRFDSFLVLAPQ